MPFLKFLAGLGFAGALPALRQRRDPSIGTVHIGWRTVLRPKNIL